MSREKMLQAEVALKNEQLTDLTKEVERLRRQAEESGKRAQTAVGNESKIAELKQTIGKLAPVAKKVVQYAAELQEARRRLAVVEREPAVILHDRDIIREKEHVLQSLR
jgi:uncharacterized protein (DUF342 family)